MLMRCRTETTKLPRPVGGVGRSGRCQRPAAALVLIALLGPLAGLGAFAQERLFEVVPPEKVAFNYPEPPREGAPDYFTIAEEGEAQCVIVQPAGTSRRGRRAGAALCAYLRLVTGGRFRLLADGQAAPAGMAAIHVGDTSVGLNTELALPDVRYGDDVFPNLNGYLVKTPDPKTLVIRGPTETATMHGVVGFLKRYVGVRQYWAGPPGGLGDVVPSRPTLRVPELEWRDWPYFFSRNMSMYAFGHGAAAADFFRKNQTLRCSENYNLWLPPAEYATPHPEYFPLVCGKRSLPAPARLAAGWQPCVSNPEVVRAMAAGVTEYFRENPDAVGINFSVNDGNGDCMCAACRAMDDPDADYSLRIGLCDRYTKLTNQVCDIVGREFPDKAIVFLAYSAACKPPRTVKLHPVVMPVLTVPGSTFTAWDAWMKTGARRMGVYLHHDDDMFFILPKLDVRQTVRRIRYAVGSGRARLFYMEMFPHWPFDGAVPYVTAELLWDPRQKVEPLLEAFCADLFGPAAEPMRTFYGTIEADYERWVRAEGEPHWFGPDLGSMRYSRSPEQFRVLTPDAAASAAAALTQAAAAAQSDARATERIRVVSLMFRLQELGVQHYWTAKGLREGAVRSEADARRTVAEARRLVALGRAMHDYVCNVLEQPPADAYRLFKRPPRMRQNSLYERIRSGKPDPETGVAVTAGANAVTEFLRQSLGPEQAAAWWRSVRQAEQEPLLVAAFENAELRARGVEIKNLLPDPGLEEAGRELAPDEFALDRDILLAPAQEARVGIRHWFAERSPYRTVLTQEEAHSGHWSLLLERCHRVRVTRLVHVEPGWRCRVGFWLKRNAGSARYTATVTVRLKDRTEVQCAAIRVPDRPDQWQELAVDATMPPEARLLILRVFVNVQAPDARCWLDDFLIGRYPAEVEPRD